MARCRHCGLSLHPFMWLEGVVAAAFNGIARVFGG